MCHECATERGHVRPVRQRTSSVGALSTIEEFQEQDDLTSPMPEERETTLAEEYVRCSQGEEVEGSYYIGPPSMVDQEIRDEENYNFQGVLDDDEYDLEEYFDDEPGTIAVYTKMIDASQGADREGWMAAGRDELGHIVEKGVKTDYDYASFA